MASAKKSKKATRKKVGKKAKAKGAAPPLEENQTALLPFEGDETQRELLYPAATIAEMLGITDRHLRRLANEGIIPKATRGRYPLTGCVQGYIRHLQQLKMGTDERVQEATRLSRVRADSYELELQIKNKKLYRADVIDQALFHVCTDLTAMLQGSASRIASQLGGGATLRKRLVDEFYEIREQFAAGLREFSGRLRKDGWDSRPATRPGAGRVGKKKSRTAKRKRRTRSV